MARMAKCVATATLHAPVDATFPLENLQEALARAMESGRQGKVLLDAGEALTKTQGDECQDESRAR